MIMDEVREYTFEELRRIVKPIAESYGMRPVYLFGSRARGDNREDSDYDFCVVTPMTAISSSSEDSSPN